jgi:hypothetical protein
LQPREQKRNESGRLRQQISQVLVTPLPGLACGRPLRNTILALLITYVCTCERSISFPTSDTRITLWYDDRRICTTKATPVSRRPAARRKGVDRRRI